jgi:hypothetical protein
MRTIYAFLIAAFLFPAFPACDVINPSEPVPTYVRIDSFSFSGVAATTGSNSHKITHVWAYFNNNPVGNFDLPAQFPVIANEPGTLLVLAGIDYDGLRGFGVAYPLYLPDTMTLTPQPGKVISLTPKTGYNEKARLSFHENFDAGAGRRNAFQPFSPDSTYLLNVIQPDTNVFEGGGSGLIELSGEADSTLVLSLPTAAITPGADAYIELNYKGDMSMRVGMYSVINTTGVPYWEELIGLKPQDQWTKIYIGIREFILANRGNEYRVVLRAYRARGQSNGRLYIDNLKVVNF